MLRTWCLLAVLLGCSRSESASPDPEQKSSPDADKKVSRFNYIPTGEQTYAAGMKVYVSVNSLHSHDGIVKYDFYSLKFCSPDKDSLTGFQEEKLGQILWGDKIDPSKYELLMMKDEKCKLVNCKNGERKVTAADLQKFEKRINSNYRGNFIIDNLPVVGKGETLLPGSTKGCKDYAPRGWPLGVPSRCSADGSTLINNHVDFVISVNKHEDGVKSTYSVVAVNVHPRSIAHASEDNCNAAFDPEAKHTPLTTRSQETKEIIWSYSVKWKIVTDITWATRWDAYLSLALSNSNARVHWVSIINSLLIIMCLSVVVAMILLRTLHMDFNRYNNPEYADEQQEEMGWKLVHGDVFRTPEWPALFSATIGTGVQLLGMFVLSLFFALLGFLSPANRGGLITVAMLLFVLMSLVNGVVTGVMLNMFSLKQWKIVFLSGMLYPGFLFILWLFTEGAIFFNTNGTNTAPFMTIFTLMGLWFGVSLPLVLMGAGFGFRSEKIEPAVKVQKLPRNIPPQRWYLESWVLCFFPGIIPFGAAFIELRYILYSMWQGMVYYVFGFLAISCGTVVITAAEVAVVIVYFLLVFEDHKWWWKSVLIPGGMGLHFFLYSIYYYRTQLHVRTWLATFIYFQTMGVISLSIWIAVGTIGFVSCFFFTRAIYTRIKID